MLVPYHCHQNNFKRKTFQPPNQLICPEITEVTLIGLIRFDYREIFHTTAYSSIVIVIQQGMIENYPTNISLKSVIVPCAFINLVVRECLHVGY